MLIVSYTSGRCKHCSSIISLEKTDGCAAAFSVSHFLREGTVLAVIQAASTTSAQGQGLGATRDLCSCCEHTETSFSISCSLCLVPPKCPRFPDPFCLRGLAHAVPHGSLLAWLGQPSSLLHDLPRSPQDPPPPPQTDLSLVSCLPTAQITCMITALGLFT